MLSSLDSLGANDNRHQLIECPPLTNNNGNVQTELSVVMTENNAMPLPVSTLIPMLPTQEKVLTHANNSEDEEPKTKRLKQSSQNKKTTRKIRTNLLFCNLLTVKKIKMFVGRIGHLQFG